MSDTPTYEQFPKGVLYGAAIMLLVAFLAALVGRNYDLGTLRTPEGTPVASRDINFADRPDGAVIVYEVPSEHVISVLEPGAENFIRVVMRGFVRERKRRGIGAEQPFSLSRWSDGRVMLVDETTGRTVQLNAFGKTNVGAFERLLDAKVGSL